jgi:hypothetical protein
MGPDTKGIAMATSADPPSEVPTPEQAALSDALQNEYSMLTAMLTTVWSASLTRVSLFLGVVSAMGVALGFAAQAGGGFGSTFSVFALVALPQALFLGIGTFARTLELQREAIVYITGMNRIRHVMAETVPAAKPHFVLPIYDDERGVFRSQGTGIRLHPPRYRLAFALVQTQGIVAIICATLAGAIGGLGTAWISAAVGWGVAAIAFLVTIIALLAFWSRSIASLYADIRPMYPTPPEAIDRPI